jgi:hypothetical protein
MGDVIYDKTCENNALREQIGNVDEEIIRRKLNDSKLKSNEQKNNVIRINKTHKQNAIFNQNLEFLNKKMF